MKATILAVCLSLLLGSASISQAANIVDPNNTGANGVFYSFGIGGYAFLTNPVADPLSLPLGEDLAVGLALHGTGGSFYYDGEFLISAGSDVSNEVGDIASLGTTGIVTVDGIGSTWTNAGRLQVGRGGDATLTIQNGGSVSNDYGYVSSLSTGTGTVTVDGTGSMWTNSDGLYVGYSGNATLAIQNGGTVSSDFGVVGFDTVTSLVTVDGAGSFWTNTGTLDVGYWGDGTLSIQNSGRISSDDGYVGRLNGSMGTVTIDGINSEWSATSGTLYVGDEGNGILTLQNSGRVFSAGGSVGASSGGTGTVTVTGMNSQWLTSLFYVGDEGNGTLAIQNGGNVTNNATGYVGRLSGGTGTVTVDGISSRWNNLGSLYVGDEGDGTLTIQNGGVVTGSGTVGRSSGGTGTVTVNGFGSLWDSPGTLRVGNEGDGTLTIENGGTVSGLLMGYVGSSSGGKGTVTVDGAGSKLTPLHLLYVGDEGDGTLTIQNGGTVSHGASGYVGNRIGGTGSVTVDGIGSEWTTTGNLNVGEAGDGTLAINNGGFVFSASSGVVGRLSGSTGTVTVDGTGSRWNNFGSLSVGTAGDGTLTIQNGGRVFNDTTGSVGSSSGSTGTVTVNGAGSIWTSNGGLRVGDAGNGTLAVQNGGRVSSVGIGYIGRQSGGTGLVTIDGAGTIWDSIQDLYLGGDNMAAGGTGILTVQGGGQVSVSNLVLIWNTSQVNLDNGTLNATRFVLDGGIIEGYGTINTPSSTFSNPVINNGQITGNSLANPITLTGYIIGTGTLDNVLMMGTDAPGIYLPASVVRGSVDYAGTLEIELGGTFLGDYDQIEHSLGAGIANVGGVLDVQLVNGFVPSAGDRFDILTAVSLAGTFSSINFPLLPFGLEWFINYDATSIELVATYGADFAEDGDVDGPDLALWQTGYGITTGATHMQGDADANGGVDGFDFLMWQQQYTGNLIPATAASTTVPEPSSLLLGVMAALGLLPLYRRRKIQ